MVQRQGELEAEIAAIRANVRALPARNGRPRRHRQPPPPPTTAAATGCPRICNGASSGLPGSRRQSRRWRQRRAPPRPLVTPYWRRRARSRAGRNHAPAVRATIRAELQGLGSRRGKGSPNPRHGPSALIQAPCGGPVLARRATGCGGTGWCKRIANARCRSLASEAADLDTPDKAAPNSRTAKQPSPDRPTTSLE